MSGDVQFYILRSHKAGDVVPSTDGTRQATIVKLECQGGWYELVIELDDGRRVTSHFPDRLNPIPVLLPCEGSQVSARITPTSCS